MTSYNSPGVYVEEIAKFPPAIVPVATAVPAFIGYTGKAKDALGNSLANVPTRITSLLEYERNFGKTIPQKLRVDVSESGPDISVKFNTANWLEPSPYPLLYYSLQLYFNNGGGPCYIVSIGNVQDSDEDYSPITIKTSDFTNALTKLEEYDEPTLIVLPDACIGSDADTSGGGEGGPDGIPDHAPMVGDIVNEALKHCKKMQDRFTIADVFRAVKGGTDDHGKVTTHFREKITGDLDELKYGAAYFPYLKTTIPFHTDDTKIEIVIHDLGTLSGPISNIKTSHTAVYNAIKAFITANATVTLPPSGAIAGVYARVDKARGVWKAPANVSLTNVIGPAADITEDINGGLNIDAASGKSVNAIRAFTGHGTLVWGARTLAGNDNEWRYVSVRRFFIMTEESVEKATAQFVFEPNDANTWVKVRSMIENFLTLQWRAGALAGAKPDEAFYVKVGLNQTMTAQDILNGFMNIEIGMAVVRPAEFIILRFSHKMQES